VAPAQAAKAPNRDAARAGEARGGYPAAARGLLREMLLDAARALLEQRGWAQVTMAEIAARAGVSRQTLYNVFGSRDELAQAFVLREQQNLLADVERTIRSNADAPVRAVQAAFERFLELAAHDPVLRRAFTDQAADGMAPLLTTRGAPVVEGAVARLAEVIGASWPQAPRVEVEVMADCLVRLAISHAMLPREQPRATARAIAALLAPHIERVLG
jgi:AcrR family transcriptional regulator